MDAATAAAAYTTRGEALFQAGGCEVVAAGEVSHTLQIGDHKSLCVRISPMALGFFDVGYVPVS